MRIFFFRLELQGHEVRSIYLATCYLKMNRIAEECAKYLIKNLNIDNCIDIRSLPGISSKKSFVCQLDDFISTMVSNLSDVKNLVTALALFLFFALYR